MCSRHVASLCREAFLFCLFFKDSKTVAIKLTRKYEGNGMSQRGTRTCTGAWKRIMRVRMSFTAFDAMTAPFQDMSASFHAH